MSTAPTPGQGAAVPLAPARAHDSIAAGTGMDAVTLLVGDLDRQLRFYRDAPRPRRHRAARRPVRAGPASVTLGRGSTPLVILQHTPDLPPAVRGAAGLFHTAILFDDEAGLAATLASVAQREPTSYVGSADHLVSLAFYFTDPEGNGVELYWDRSRSLWNRDADGRIEMGSLRLDPNAFLGEHLTDELLEQPGAGDAVVGHVHLSVGDVPSARAFYVDALGFDVTAEWHGALFVSAGGYHHHLAMNTWNSAGAGPRASALGLGEVRIAVPTADDLGALADRVGVRRLRHRARRRDPAVRGPLAQRGAGQRDGVGRRVQLRCPRDGRALDQRTRRRAPRRSAARSRERVQAPVGEGVLAVGDRLQAQPVERLATHDRVVLVAEHLLQRACALRALRWPAGRTPPTRPRWRTGPDARPCAPRAGPRRARRRSPRPARRPCGPADATPRAPRGAGPSPASRRRRRPRAGRVRSAHDDPSQPPSSSRPACSAAVRSSSMRSATGPRTSSGRLGRQGACGTRAAPQPGRAPRRARARGPAGRRAAARDRRRRRTGRCAGAASRSWRRAPRRRPRPAARAPSRRAGRRAGRGTRARSRRRCRRSPSGLARSRHVTSVPAAPPGRADPPETAAVTAEASAGPPTGCRPGP